MYNLRSLLRKKYCIEDIGLLNSFHYTICHRSPTRTKMWPWKDPPSHISIIKRYMLSESINEILWCLIGYPIIPVLIIMLISKLYPQERTRRILQVKTYTLYLIFLHMMLVSYDLEKIQLESLGVRAGTNLILSLVADYVTRSLFRQQGNLAHVAVNDLWRFLSLTDYTEMVYAVSLCKGLFNTYIIICLTLKLNGRRR